MAVTKKSLHYLATPFKKHPLGPWKAHFDACRCAAQLIEQGYLIYSPIAHSFIIDGHCRNPIDWLDYDEYMIAYCAALIVAKFPTWEESEGVKREAEFARAISIPILYYCPYNMSFDIPPAHHGL